MIEDHDALQKINNVCLAATASLVKYKLGKLQIIKKNSQMCLIWDGE